MRNEEEDLSQRREGTENTEEEQTLFFPLRALRPLRLCERNYRITAP